MSDHAPITLQLGDRPIRLPAVEHDIPSKANWTGYTNFLKNEVRPTNLNNHLTPEIDRLLDKIDAATTSARNSFIPRWPFKYSDRNNSTPKFHRLQKILAQIYILMHDNASTPQSFNI